MVNEPTRFVPSAYHRGMTPVARPTAAFFDLDKTIIAKSSTLAFSRSSRPAG